MKYPPKAGRFVLGPWVKGLNNVEAQEDLENSEFAAGLNMVLDKHGEAETRPGLIQRVVGTNASGFFAVTNSEGIYTDNGDLIRLDARTWTTTTLISGLAEGRKLSAVVLGPRVYWTNGIDYGRIHVPTWETLEGFGTVNPAVEVTLTPTAYGDLPAGRYLLALTYVDAWGEESGTTKLHFVELSSQGGIAVALSAPAPAGVGGVRLYMTEPNGTREELYRVLELDDDETSAVITLREFGQPISTLFLQPIPVPDLVTAYNGHLFFAIGSMVWASETMRYGLYHEDFGEIGSYPQDVSVLERGHDGVFVSADRTYSYVGNHPNDFTLLDNVFNYEGVKGSGCQIDRDLFSLENVKAKQLPMWFTSRGAVLGMPGGTVMPVSRGRAEPDVYRRGVSGTVEFNGIETVLTALEERERPGDAVRLQDTFSATVIKRGLTDA